MSIALFVFVVIVVLILALYVIRKLAPMVKADGDLVNILEAVAVVIAILVILDHAGVLR